MVKRLIPISEASRTERLKFENPWWVADGIEPEFDSMRRRLYFELFYPLVSETDIRRSIVLMGPRRVGKTVMIYHAIARLLGEGHGRRKICFIGVDNPLYLNMGLEELFALARESAGNPDPKGWFVFFDEVQYLKDWELHLKILTDSYPHTKFIVSGSAAAALKYRSRESGAGRFTEFLLPPLTFHEYIHLKGLEGIMRPPGIHTIETAASPFFSTINLKELNRHFLDYINFGGYPEVIFSEKIQSNPARYIKSDIIDKVLLRDLPGLYGIRDVQELNAFFATLVYYTGCEVSLENLCKSSGVDKNTIKKYLEYLEAAFLIRIIHRVDDNAKRFQRMNFFKVYLTNPSLRSALFTPIRETDDNYGNMVETAIFSQQLHQESFTPYYARWGTGSSQGEVDMITLNLHNFKPNQAVEIKSTNRPAKNPKELKSLIQFCERNHLSSALVTTYDHEGIQEINGIRITFLPSSVYAYGTGCSTLKQKQDGSY